MSGNIHPTAVIAPEAVLGANVEIAAYTIIHGNVHIGDNCKIGSYCEIGVPTPLGDGSPLVIGEGSTIRSHAVFYESSRFGERLTTGHRVTVREKTVAGKNLQIGSLNDIQGDCEIGDYVRFHSNVFVAKLSKIGNFVWLLPYTILTNDPTPPSDDWVGCSIEDFATISARSTILPGVRVGKHALVAAHACVTKDVPAYRVVGGIPAKVLGKTSAVKRRAAGDESAYPWPRHFTRGYPQDVVAQWKAELADTAPDEE